MREKRKEISITVVGLAVSFVITATTIYLYRNLKPASDMVFHVIQTVSYLLMTLETFLFMKLSRKPLKEFGLFKRDILKQVISAVIMIAVLMVLALVTGWRPTAKEGFWLLAFKQVFVAFSEELLFRGFVITMFKEIFATTRRVVFWSALLFGLWHYPWGQNIGQVISTFIFGLIFGALRTVYEDTDSEIGIPALAAVHWVMNTIL